MKKKPHHPEKNVLHGADVFTKEPSTLASHASHEPLSPFLVAERQGTKLPATAFPVVGIVASAGGLNAFRNFFSSMPGDSGMAFARPPHLAPPHKSQMAELVRQGMSVPVPETRNGTSVQDNHVYVIPARYFLAISGGKLELIEPSMVHGRQTSLYFFSRSLAHDQRDYSIGIVLSGTGDHGSAGAGDIKQAGGIVMAQAPETAEYDQMPLNAIDTGAVDCGLAPNRMPEALMKHASRFYPISASTIPAHASDPFKRALDSLRLQNKHEFGCYRDPMALPAIQNRTRFTGVAGLAEYVGFVEHHPEEATALANLLVLSSAAFFRDPEAYELVNEQTNPLLAERQTQNTPVRIWVPACTTGEKVYSMAIRMFDFSDSAKELLQTDDRMPTGLPNDLLPHRGGDHRGYAKVQIFASDIDTDAIEYARTGIYPASVCGDVPADILRRHFVMVDADHYRKRQSIRESITFYRSKLTHAPPSSKIYLIISHNLLVFLEPRTKQNLLALFHSALVAGGYLLLGTGETIGGCSDLFEPMPEKPRMYRKKDSPSRHSLIILENINSKSIERTPFRSRRKELRMPSQIPRMANRQLLNSVAEPDRMKDDFMNLMKNSGIAMIELDDKLHVKRFTSPTNRLFNLSDTDIGRPLRDITANFSDDRLLTECQQVLDTLIPIEQEIETDAPPYYLRRILPYCTDDHSTGGLLIMFLDVTDRRESDMAQQENDLRHVAELQQCVDRMRSILDSVADAIVTFDRLGKIDSVNSATESLFGYQRGELVGENLSLLVPSRNCGGSAGVESSHNQFSAERNDEYRQEVSARRKDGTRFPSEFATRRVDHLNLFVGVLRDVSDQKQLQAYLLEIASDEQRRIGQELHDGIQQELTGLSLFAGALSSLLENAKPGDNVDSLGVTLTKSDFERITQTATKLSQGLKEVNNHVRDLSHGIMPVQIDAEGLRSALGDLANATNELDQVHCHFEFSGPSPIANNSIATQLYRITQESISNALKHGLADEIDISLLQGPDQIILEISNNGIGFEPRKSLLPPTEGDGIGIRTMKYRASTIGGVLQVDVNNGIGTTVRCTVPVTGS